MSVSEFLKEHKITVGLVGTTIVLATAYGSCEFTPAVPAEKPAEEAPAVEEEPAEEEKAEEEEPAAEEEAEEAPAEEAPAED